MEIFAARLKEGTSEHAGDLSGNVMEPQQSGARCLAVSAAICSDGPAPYELPQNGAAARAQGKSYLRDIPYQTEGEKKTHRC